MEDSDENSGQRSEQQPFGRSMDRRQFLKAAGLTGVAVGVASAFGGLAKAEARPAQAKAAPADVSGDCVAVLGLGAGPVFYPDRNNTGFALFHNGRAYLVDCGANTPNKFYRLGVTFDKIKGLFFTHYHFDHTAGYADLLSRGFQANQPATNMKALDVYGPSLPMAGAVNGLDALSNGIMAGFASGYAIHNWTGRPVTPMPAVTNHAIDPAAPGVVTVLDDPDMLVDAIQVDHDEAAGVSYAYRFTLRDGSSRPTGKVVVFSGDRTHYNARRDPSSAYYAPGGPGYGKPPYFPEHPTNTEFQQAFKAFALGATVLVHEVSLRSWANKIADPNANPFMNMLYWHLIDSHADVSEIPIIARDANVGTVVLSHYSNIDDTYTLTQARDLCYQGVIAANYTASRRIYGGKIIAPLEGDVIRF